MYGMVNQAVKAMVTEHHGTDVWQAICEEAGLDGGDFSLMQSYQDDVTYGLVGAACKVLGLRPEPVLETFGHYWIQYAKTTSYSRMLDFAGSSLEEFLENLDQMHSRIKVSLPELSPPSFDVDTDAEGNLEVHYFSHREGLAPMVKGLLAAVAENFDAAVDVTHRESKASGADHDVFVLVARTV